MKNNIVSVWILVLIFLVYVVLAVPSPHTTRGNVDYANGSYATGGIPLIFNNTVLDELTYSQTNGKGPDHIDSAYTVSLGGSDGDTITLIAYTTREYGVSSTNMISPTTALDVTINLTRPSETNVSILDPSNNSLYNISEYFDLLSRVAIMGGVNGVDCSAILSISDENIITLASGENYVNSLGDILLDDYGDTTWNLSTIDEGNVSVSVEGSCTTDGINFEGYNVYILRNVSVIDQKAPLVSLEYPLNNSNPNEAEAETFFKYNVSDDKGIANCSLYINDILNSTNTSIQKGVSQNFSVKLYAREYNWSVVCYDNSSQENVGYSDVFNLSVIANIAPTVSGLSILNPIDLTPGSSVFVTCNGTVTDSNGVSDIDTVNATLFHETVDANGPDDNNIHYSNTSCTILGVGTYTVNYSCGFAVEYYASNGSWSCNMTALDQGGKLGTGELNTYVNDLLAIDISPGTIDYGNLLPGATSADDLIVNITNFGNIDFNVSLLGYVDSYGDNLSFVCTKNNISVEMERYSVYAGKQYSEMINLTGELSTIENLTLPHRNDDTIYKSDRNQTYWRLELPYNIQGNCSGNIMFQAVFT